MAEGLSNKTKAVIEQLVVQEGRSYVDAIRRAKEMAYAASRPYLQAADELQRALNKIDEREHARLSDPVSGRLVETSTEEN